MSVTRNQISPKVSTFVESQFPQFIRENYPAFVEFVQSYYQWSEQASANGYVYQSKQLINYNDIDTTTNDFIKYFVNDFLPYFPNNTALNQVKLIKVARQFYQTKGSLQSFQFLFRVIYGLEADIYYPKNQILRCSDGKWVQPQSLQIVINNEDENFDYLKLVGCLGVGSISNVSCVIESATIEIDPGLGFEILELFVSNITGTFADLENLNVVYGFDANNNPLIFSEKIITALSGIAINPKNGGLRYRTGNPVVISGGLEAADPNAQKAVAVVGNVTSGSISGVGVAFGGYYYRASPNAVVTVVNGPGDNTGTGANVILQSIDTGNLSFLNLNTDSIEFRAPILLSSANYQFSNFAFTNTNTTLATAFAFTNTAFGPILSMNVINGGGDFTQVPSINIQTTYYSDFTTDFAAIGDVPDTLATQQYVDDLGYIAAVQVINGGQNYSNVTDKIVAMGVYGYGATFSFITTPSGSIKSVTVTNAGAGYFQMPPLALANSANNANAANGTGATLLAYGYGQGAQLSVAVNKIGVIEDIVMLSRGFDYVSTPNVSLRVWDLPIVPIANGNFFIGDSVIYQGINANNNTPISTGLTFAQKTIIQGGNFPPDPTSFSSVVVAGTVIVAGMNFIGTDPGIVTVVDNVNTGNYSPIAKFYDPTSGVGFGWWWKIANANGTPTISASLQTDSYGTIIGSQITGFVGTPTVDTTLTNVWTGATSPIAVTARTGFNNEILLIGQSQTSVAYPSPWTDMTIGSPGGAYRELGYVISSTAGTNDDFNAATDGAWLAVLAGIYDAPISVSTNTGSLVTTFSALIDSYNVSTSTLRIYNYQGTLNSNANLISSTVNATVNLAATGGILPQPFGNGLAKANAIFQDGLISYPGFYTATDGFLSADQYTQDSNTYHPYSYKIIVEKGLHEYKKVLTNIVHPAGMSMLGVYTVTDYSNESTQAGSNVNITPATSGATINANAFASPAHLIAVGGNFVGNVNVGDMVFFNYNDTSRPSFTKLVTAVNSANNLMVESNTMFFFDNPVAVTNGTNTITSIGFSGNVDITDIITLNISGNLITSKVTTTSPNTLTVNTVFNANLTNTVMIVYPAINTASYQIVKAAT